MHMAPRKGYLKIYEAGKLTVVGFGSHEILDQIVVSDCRDEIANIIAQSGCQTLAFDLTGVKLIPSGMLGMLSSLGRLGVQVCLFNPSDEIREVLEITRLDSILQVHSVAV
jgi:anti-anti-sigma factor